jgi:hypothetical protein
MITPSVVMAVNGDGPSTVMPINGDDEYSDSGDGPSVWMPVNNHGPIYLNSHSLAHPSPSCHLPSATPSHTCQFHWAAPYTLLSIPWPTHCPLAIFHRPPRHLHAILTGLPPPLLPFLSQPITHAPSSIGPIVYETSFIGLPHIPPLPFLGQPITHAPSSIAPSHWPPHCL